MATKAVATRDSSALAPGLSEKELDLVRKTVARDLSNDELGLFFYECTRRGVHPLDRLIHPVKRNNKDGGTSVTFQASIDYLRSLAHETGRCVSISDPVFDTEDAEHPNKASVTVKALLDNGMVAEYTVTARWEEYYPGEKLGWMWRTKPYLMLGKCAEALALRKAFPLPLRGLYAQEELTASFSDAGDTTSAPLSEQVHESGAQPQQAEVVTEAPASMGGDELTPCEQLLHELFEMCPDPKMAPALLKQASVFKGRGGELKWITIEALKSGKVKDRWCETSLASLRKIKERGE